VVEEMWGRHVCTIKPSALGHLRDKVAARILKKQEYLLFTLVKSNWEATNALRYISRAARVSLRRFGSSGMKDKNAVTAQRISLWRGDARAMLRLRLSNMFLKDFDYADERITLGNHTENRFTITIRNIPLEKENIREVLSRFGEEATIKGVPNYYGAQRLEGGNAEVGKALKDGELRLGVELILRKTQPYLQKGIEAVPKALWYERDMLRHLEKYPSDYAGALRRIPKRIQKLYLNAYQSSIFNEELDRALRGGSTPTSIAVPGFDVPRMPELSTVAFERKSLIAIRGFKIFDVGEGVATVGFRLGKGEYASTVLFILTNRR